MLGSDPLAPDALFVVSDGGALGATHGAVASDETISAVE